MSEEEKVLTIEESVKDIVQRKLADGTIEKIVEEQFEKAISTAIGDIMGSYGSVTKALKEHLSSALVPYIEGYDYSKYIIKLDAVLSEIIQNSTQGSNVLLENFKDIMTSDAPKEITVTELFGKWAKHVSKEVETSGLEVEYDDGPMFECVDIEYEFKEESRRTSYSSSFSYGKVLFTCEHDDSLNIEVNLTRYSEDKHWTLSGWHEVKLSSLRNLSDFKIFLLKLEQNFSHITLDTKHLSDSVRPEEEPEASY